MSKYAKPPLHPTYDYASGSSGEPVGNTLDELLKNIRPATEEELRIQRESIGKNYQPGERQATPFRPVGNTADLPSDGDCMGCGYPCEVWFAPNGVWNAVVPERVGKLCLRCFAAKAERLGINKLGWELRQDEIGFVPTAGLPPLETRTICPLCNGTKQVERIGFGSAGEMDAGGEPRKLIQSCRTCSGRGFLWIPPDEMEKHIRTLQAELITVRGDMAGLQASLDHGFRYPPFMDEPYPKDPDQMSVEELERAGEYSAECKCVACHWWQYMLKLRAERDAAIAELNDKENENDGN